jgi:cullin-associated NEDD8-dissociated protein 1
MDMESEDESDDEEGYSDDEDMSWKCRKAASRLLATCIATRPESVKSLVRGVGSVLVDRFSEREESVRLDIFASFSGLLRMVDAACGADPASMDSIE